LGIVTIACLDEVRELLGDVLKLGKRTARLNADTPLFGSMPELDSMAILLVVVAIEERFQIKVEDEEASAETFATLGTLATLVELKRAR
jgi:acyl carrier protein